MFTWFNRILPVILSLFLVGCKMSSSTVLQKNDENKVNVTISGSKETGIKLNN